MPTPQTQHPTIYIMLAFGFGVLFVTVLLTGERHELFVSIPYGTLDSENVRRLKLIPLYQELKYN